VALSDSVVQLPAAAELLHYVNTAVVLKRVHEPHYCQAARQPPHDLHLALYRAGVAAALRLGGVRRQRLGQALAGVLGAGLAVARHPHDAVAALRGVGGSMGSAEAPCREASARGVLAPACIGVLVGTAPLSRPGRAALHRCPALFGSS
jgi:hypothetical protein